MEIKSFVILLYFVSFQAVSSMPYDDVPKTDLSKRSAAALSKFLLQSLSNQMEAEGKAAGLDPVYLAHAQRRLLDQQLNSPYRSDTVVNLERREPKQNEVGRKYMRCYFNAVSCF